MDWGGSAPVIQRLSPFPVIRPVHGKTTLIMAGCGIWWNISWKGLGACPSTEGSTLPIAPGWSLVHCAAVIRITSSSFPSGQTWCLLWESYSFTLTLLCASVSCKMYIFPMFNEWWMNDCYLPHNQIIWEVMLFYLLYSMTKRQLLGHIFGVFYVNLAWKGYE